MLDCKEPNGTMQRTVCVTIRPTPTELADAIWSLTADEQVVLLGCLKRRFCNNEAGSMQMEYIANALSDMTTEKSDEVKDFVRYLVDCVFLEPAK